MSRLSTTPETLEAIQDALAEGPRTIHELMAELGHSQFKITTGVNQLQRLGRVARERAAITATGGAPASLWRLTTPTEEDDDYVEPDSPEALRERAIRDNALFLAALRKYECYPANRMLREGNPVSMRGLPTGGQSAIALCAERGDF